MLCLQSSNYFVLKTECYVYFVKTRTRSFTPHQAGKTELSVRFWILSKEIQNKNNDKTEIREIFFFRKSKFQMTC